MKKVRLNLWNSCYHSVQNLVTSVLYLETVKVLRILILTAVLYGYGTWSLPVREENGLRMCEKRVLRNVFWTKWEEVTGGRIKLLMRNLMIHTPCQIFLG